VGIHFPTAFSPDGIGDPLNENYTIIVGKDIKEFMFYIYDRWGNVMFESSSKTLKWNGTYKGLPCNSGVYAYMADVVYITGEKKVFSGNITLIR
jgi:gliding motility-associated-like protein